MPRDTLCSCITIFTKEKTVYNIELKSEIGNVTQNNYIKLIELSNKIIFTKELYRLAIKHIDVKINIS